MILPSIVSLLISCALLNSDTHQARESAGHEILSQDHDFGDVREVYDMYSVREWPEVKLSLHEILWILYQDEFASLHTKYYGSNEVDYDSLRAAFEREIKYGGYDGGK